MCGRYSITTNPEAMRRLFRRGLLAMPRVCLLLVGFQGVLLVSTAVHAAEPGTYYCVTDHMAGIQYRDHAPKGADVPFVGEINPIPYNIAKFTVKVMAWPEMTVEEQLWVYLHLPYGPDFYDMCTAVAQVEALFPPTRYLATNEIQLDFVPEVCAESICFMAGTPTICG